MSTWQPGMRVKISFANRLCIGLVLAVNAVTEETKQRKLKTIEERLDDEALLTTEMLEVIDWVSQYYHHPIGDCFQAALPKQLRKGKSAELDTELVWYRNQENEIPTLGEKQQACLAKLTTATTGISQSVLNQHLGNVTSSLKGLEKKGLIYGKIEPKLPLNNQYQSDHCTLNTEQQTAVSEVWQQKQTFLPFLLEGITGSGKTEVYIELAERTLNEGKQVLVLIPEIGLTSQFVTRFKQRLNAHIVIIHSGISDGERRQAWLLAKHGLAQIIIGTRSAVFTPLDNPGLIIIDEEHDSSYKQQDGLRYHARNVALIRAQKCQIPIVMGSATPSLESLHQKNLNRYQPLRLTQRAGNARLPNVKLVDSQTAHPDHGISSLLLEAIQQHLAAGNQVILFINRRGYAPVLMCHDCGWQATCQHCDARMVVHQHRHQLFCHHCGAIQRLVDQCPKCDSTNLKSYGAGTEKIEQWLQKLFPQTPVLRIDRDTTQRVNAFAELVEELKQQQPRILVGTQMLAKGHDFHDVTLVGVLDSDQGLYSADFRATETLAQLITQVTGRAGRGDKKGEVYIQTAQPEHPFWQQLLQQGYSVLAQQLLTERQEMGLPPVNNWAVIRAESVDRELAMQFLGHFQSVLQQHPHPQVIVLGPVPALMEKKNGRFRAQLLLTSEHRKPIHQVLDHHIQQLERHKFGQKLRWSIDIDPTDLI